MYCYWSCVPVWPVPVLQGCHHKDRPPVVCKCLHRHVIFYIRITMTCDLYVNFILIDNTVPTSKDVEKHPRTMLWIGQKPAENLTSHNNAQDCSRSKVWKILEARSKSNSTYFNIKTRDTSRSKLHTKQRPSADSCSLVHIRSSERPRSRSSENLRCKKVIDWYYICLMNLNDMKL